MCCWVISLFDFGCFRCVTHYVDVSIIKLQFFYIYYEYEVAKSEENDDVAYKTI